MSDSSLTVKIDDFDDEYPPNVTYMIDRDQLTIDLTYYSDTHITAEKYLALINAIKDSQDYELTYCDSNGYVAIHNNAVSSLVEFYISKHGAGGDGEMKISMPNMNCVHSFEFVYDMLNEYETKNKKN